MTVETLQGLSILFFVLAGIFLLIGIALFFLLDVPKIYGDLSGRTAQKAIEAIRQQNERSGTKGYKPSTVNAARGKLTDRIDASGRVREVKTELPVGVGTEKFSTAELTPQTGETTVLDATTVLESTGETTVLDQSVGSAGETTVLTQPEEQAVAECTSAEQTVFTLNVEMAFTESSEIIE